MSAFDFFRWPLTGGETVWLVLSIVGAIRLVRASES